MKVTQADGSSKITEDETHKHTPVIPRFNQYQPRVKMLAIILKEVEFTSGQTIDHLVESTQIPIYFLNRYLLDLEIEKKVAKSGSRYYSIENPLELD